MTLRIMVEFCYAVSFMLTVVYAECRYAKCRGAIYCSTFALLPEVNADFI